MKHLTLLLSLLFATLPTVAVAGSTPVDRLSFGAPVSHAPLYDALQDASWFEPLTAKGDETGRGLTALDATLPVPVARRAMDAVLCAQDQGLVVEKLLLVDMAAPASTPRLWAFDRSDADKPRLVLRDYVAHGAGSDPNRDGKAEQFSNRPNSHMTSLGLYKVAERYHGKSGWSRRLDGLFARFNGKARERAVVMHPATYVRPGRVGRSQGCPAVSQATMDRLEKAGLKNAVLWIDAEDKDLEAEVAECSQKRKGEGLARNGVEAWSSATYTCPAPFGIDRAALDRSFIG